MEIAGPRPVSHQISLAVSSLACRKEVDGPGFCLCVPGRDILTTSGSVPYDYCIAVGGLYLKVFSAR